MPLGPTSDSPAPSLSPYPLPLAKNTLPSPPGRVPHAAFMQLPIASYSHFPSPFLAPQLERESVLSAFIRAFLLPSTQTPSSQVHNECFGNA